MHELLGDVGLLPLLLLLLAAFATSMVHGATGIAGGFLLAVAAAPVLGLKAVVPVLSITMLISHGARAVFNVRQIDRSSYLRIVLSAFPFILMAALIYAQLPVAAIAFLLGSVVLLSIPATRWASSRKLRTSNSMLHIAGAVYGSISGAAIGPGMLLAPVLLGRGIGREAFVATLAAIALTTNALRIGVYGATDLLTGPYVLFGLMMGLATVPGAWIGRAILRRMTDKRHTLLVEWLVVLGGLNFYWLGYRALCA